MDIQDFNTLKASIEDSKIKLNRAEGVKEQLFTTLKTQYGFDTIEQAQAKIKEIDSIVNSDKEKKEALLTELNSVVDWSRL